MLGFQRGVTINTPPFLVNKAIFFSKISGYITKILR